MPMFSRALTSCILATPRARYETALTLEWLGHDQQHCDARSVDGYQLLARFQSVTAATDG
ncbi:hypothetical protein TIFTF001_034252 [Ficus carica]|uniref:Uncharacterized protein n=1 Tax=Ficus carica TaxID=3494 RepID=A0AA88E7B6_FICCA|nr:hypothetical protein TIFTF001_034252 [Ficus carica]